MDSAFYGQPSCTLCRIRELLFCGAFPFNRSFACTHLQGCHEKYGICGNFPSRGWCKQLEDSQMLDTKGSHHCAENRSAEHMMREGGYIGDLLSDRMVSESKFLPTVVLPPMHGIYNWVHHIQFPEQGRGCVFFTADTSNDVHVAVSAQRQTTDPMYEIVVGGWGNTTSVIRRRSQGPILCTVPVRLKKPLPDSTNDLWVSIDKKTQLIQVGRGTKPSLESLFCIYKDPKFLCEAQYICFSTWDAPATYSNIKGLPTMRIAPSGGGYEGAGGGQWPDAGDGFNDFAAADAGLMGSVFGFGNPSMLRLNFGFRLPVGCLLVLVFELALPFFGLSAVGSC